MKNLITLGFMAVIGGWVLSSAPARAQEGDPEFVNANPVWENADAAAVSARRPGRMVQAGNARFRLAHSDSINRALFGPEITEVEPPIDEGSALRAALITGLFEGLNEALPLISAAIGLGLGDDGDGPDDGNDLPDLSDLLGDITGPAIREAEPEPAIPEEQ